MKIGFKILLFFLLVSLLNCKVGEDYIKPELDSKDSYRVDFEKDSSIANMPWWELFQDTTLQNIVKTTLENNLDLKTSALRIQEAELKMGIVRSNLYPRIDYSGDAALSIEDGSSFGSFNPTVSLSYEIDLWGKFKRLNESALNEYLSTEQAYQSITISLIASVASNYLLLRDLDNRIIISEQMADSWRKYLRIMTSRYKSGLVSRVNVNQAEIQLYEALAAVKINERLRSQTENSISILMGLAPQNIRRGMALNEQVFPPVLPSGIPSDLLHRRPDILQAESQLHAQFERIGVAESLRYPSIVLSANLGAQLASSSFGFASLGAHLLGPIFNAKANKNRVEIEKNRTEQLLNSYEQTFLVALVEVEDAMIAVEKYKEEYEIRLNQMESANTAVKLSWTRFNNGLTNYLEVLDLQRSQFDSNLKASQALQLQLTSTVKLYKALGGGWIPQ